MLICFASLRASKNCFSRRFTSAGIVPLPAAIRLRRFPSMRSGWRRSHGVIDSTIASACPKYDSSSASTFSCDLIELNPGSICTSCPIGPISRTCRSWSTKSWRSKEPLRIFSLKRSVSSSPIVSLARSIRLSMSPMPRMRPASRSGWNGSSASVRSPTPMNLTGTSSTELMLSAAPPRASPSSLVRTTPVISTCSWNSFAAVTASCPAIASATNSTSVGSSCFRRSATSAIIVSSTCSRPAVSTSTCVTAVRRACAIPRSAISPGFAPVPSS